MELIDEKVKDDCRLHDKEGLVLRPARLQLVVGFDTNYHVACHHGGLNDDPALLHAVA